MYQITVSQLQDIAEAMEIEPSAVRTNYSGRGMYGTECVGFDLNSITELFRLGVVCGELFVNVRELGEPSTDSMGMGVIVYFRGVQLADGESWDPDTDY